MAIVGEIARRARAELPSTWDALSNATNLYGEPFLQDHIDDVKWQLFQREVNVSEEPAMDRQVLRYAGKLVATRIIPGAIDFWNDQAIAETATGTNEQQQFPDRPRNLFELYSRLLKELSGDLGAAIDLILGPRARRRAVMPTLDSDVELVTPDPWTWPAQTATGEQAQT